VTFLALFGNIWVRRAALAIAVLIALLAVRQHYINLGKTQGRASEVQHSIQGTEQVRAADFTAVTTVLTQLQVKIEASDRRQEALQAAILNLATQRQQAKEQVAGMTEAQVEAIVAKHSPRELADCVTQLPLCEQETQKQGEKIKEMDGKIVDLDSQVTTLAGYTDRLHGYYSEVWNAASQPKRSVKCVWLWKCVRPTISQPNPADLKPKG
jgi:DNA-directed RNA polymerase subunit L